MYVFKADLFAISFSASKPINLLQFQALPSPF